MVTQLRINQIYVLPGLQVVLHDVDWAQFEAILVDLGEERRSRIAYYDNTLEIRTPLPEGSRLNSYLLTTG